MSTLVADAGLTATAENPEPVVEFWNEVIENIPEWTAAGRREVTPAELRRETVHAHGIALEAIAVAGARLMIERPGSWQAALEGLRNVDWPRSNTAIWEGRALVNGRSTDRGQASCSRLSLFLVPLHQKSMTRRARHARIRNQMGGKNGKSRIG